MLISKNDQRQQQRGEGEATDEAEAEAAEEAGQQTVGLMRFFNL